MTADGASPPHHRPPHTHDDVAARVETALARLRDEGGRATPVRRAVVAALYQGDDHHVTAEDVARVVTVAHPEVHLSTVYRTLEALERAGVVTRVDLGSGGAVFHLVDHAHHHLVCRRCGAVTEIDDGDLDDLRHHLADRYGVDLAPAGQTLAGFCADCRATTAAASPLKPGPTGRSSASRSRPGGCPGPGDGPRPGRRGPSPRRP